MVKSSKKLLCLMITIMMIFGMFSFMPKAEPVVKAAEVEVEQVGATKYPAATTKTSDYTTKYYPAYTGSETSLAPALTEMGINSDKYHRTKIAVFNGMLDYQLTADENNAILKLLKAGTLLNPDYVATATTATTKATTATTVGDTSSTKYAPATTKTSDYTSKYYPAYTGTSSQLATALNSLSINSDVYHRTKIAVYNGMTNYQLTPEQNTELLNMLKAGTLLNPDYVATSTTEATEKTTATQGDTSSTKYAPATTKTSNYTSKYYPAYTGSETSLAPALDDLGINSDVYHRTKIAVYNGMTNYQLTPEQNNELLDLLEAGKLLNPDYVATGNTEATESTTQKPTTDGVGGGYDNYAGGSAGDGKIYAHGIDVSKWNEKDGDYTDVDFSFAKAKADDMDYVIIRAGSTNLGEDPMFDLYYDAAKAAGLDVGAYFFSYALTVSEAKSDANKFLSYIKGKTFEYPLYLDFETSDQDALSKTTSTNVCLAFMDIVADAGYLTGVYTGKSMSGGMDMATICAKYESWIAHYPSSNSYKTYGAAGSTYSKSYGMYQYTDSYEISGISGVMDANVCYKDYPSIVKEYGFNGYSAGGGSSSTTATETETVLPATDKSSDYTTMYYPAYTGDSTSIITALNSLSIQSSKSHRMKIALYNGMSDYSFTPEQNLELLAMLKEGTLLNPDYEDTSTEATTTTPTEDIYYPAYTGTSNSLVTALNSLDIDSSKEYRMEIAIANGMTDYTYTPEQNTELLNLLKAGKLIDPTKVDSSTTESTTTPTTESTTAKTGSWASDSNGKKYVYSDGTYATGWITINGNKYFLYEDTGYAAVGGWKQVAGEGCKFDSTGVWLETAGSIGDADCSGAIKISDVTYLQKVLANISTYDEKNTILGDVNSNGELDIRDATRIQLYLSKRITSF